MPGDLQPLASNFAIVDRDGKPNDYFIRWAQQRQIDITSGITAEQAQALIDDWAANRHVNTTTPLAGGGPLSGDLTLTHADSVVVPGTYGDATNVPQLTVDAKGHVTGVTNVAISGGGGGGGGNLVKLAQIVVSSATPSVTFSSISQSYDDLVIEFQAGVTTVNAATRLLMQMNGDTAGHYDWDYWDRYGNTGPTYNATAIALDEIPPQKTSGSQEGTKAGSIELFAYTRAHNPKMVLSHSNMRYVVSGGFAADVIPGTAIGNWNAATAVNSITLAASVNNLDVGSVFTLYGRGGAGGGGGGGSTPTLVQVKSAIGATSAVTLAAAPTAGNMLIAIATHWSTLSVTAYVNAGWTPVDITNGAVTDGYLVAMKYAVPGESATQTPFVAFNSGSTSVFEVSGALVAIPICRNSLKEISSSPMVLPLASPKAGSLLIGISCEAGSSAAFTTAAPGVTLTTLENITGTTTSNSPRRTQTYTASGIASAADATVTTTFTPGNMVGMSVMLVGG